MLAALALAGWLIWSQARPAWLWRRAEAAARAGEWDRAEAALARRAWYRPRDYPALRLRVNVALRRGDRERAARWMEGVPRSSPDAPDVALHRGRIWLELFRAAEAERAFRDAIEIDPRMVEARRALVALYGLQRRREDQEAELWSLVDAGGAPAVEALALLAVGGPVIPPDVLTRNTDEGQVLEKFLQADPDDPHARPALAHFLRQRGRVDEARALLEPWLKAHPDDHRARLALAACLLDEGDAEQARFLEREPLPGVEAALLRGQYRTLLRGEEAARADYAEAARLDLRDPEIRYRLAQSLGAANQGEAAARMRAWVEDARQLREIAVKLDPLAPDPALARQAAELCRRMGRDREAAAWERLAPPDTSPGATTARAGAP